MKTPIFKSAGLRVFVNPKPTPDRAKLAPGIGNTVARVNTTSRVAAVVPRP